MIGKPFWETGWWNRRGEVQAWLKAGFAQALQGRPFHGESVDSVADGSERIVDFAFMPIKDGTGAVSFVVPTGLDITERKRAEEEHRAAEALRQSEEKLRQHAQELGPSRSLLLFGFPSENHCFDGSRIQQPPRYRHGFRPRSFK